MFALMFLIFAHVGEPRKDPFSITNTLFCSAHMIIVYNYAEDNRVPAYEA